MICCEKCYGCNIFLYLILGSSSDFVGCNSNEPIYKLILLNFKSMYVYL